ncbi:MAG: hypothetical protein GZ085_06610 [Sulfuriferula multivorans]|uniref:Uncharacterized protein n=1 Tax=Sulfuriferula multivorans TaxID=1559896 RepID=A0A7C9JWR1_9PROT|nr:hypothetical protein [Sulfuriferula multivorans]
MSYFTQTPITCSVYVLLLVTSLLGGCGEFAYKRGASSSDLEAAKKACREQEPDAAAVKKCLADHGWVVQNLGQLESMDADPVVEASVIPSDRRIENAAAPSPVKPGVEDPVPAASVKRSPALLDTFQVSSWWKAGSGAENLKADTEACVARLGEPHQPSSQTQTATRGLLLCMKERGWSGLRAK